MPKVKRMFLCRSCGGVQPRWMGKCPDCGTWDALEETTLDPAGDKDPQKGLVAAWSELEDKSAPVASHATNAALPIDEVGANAAPLQRLASGIGEFDRVLGGGLVPASVVLLGGEPGIGKSTLLLQAARQWAEQSRRVLYVSSEESAEQIKLRFERLASGGPAPGGTLLRSVRNADQHTLASSKEGTPTSGDASSAPKSVSAVRAGSSPTSSLRHSATPSLFLLSDTNLARIVEQTRKVLPGVLIIDSVQMIYKADLPASPGSITQLRRCCAELVYLAKASGIAIVLIGHVTKEGAIAGPRLLEHLVDAVLYFEGDRYHSHRVVRAIKNRFGTTLEIGLFEMTGHGLAQVPEGAGVPALLAESRPGSVVCPILTGTRCLLVELQALTATGFLGAAKRKCSGLDANRLAMLIAVLEQHAGLRLADRDIFASSVGGLKVAEPAADLALLLAIAGAHYRRALPPATVALGEVGLGGEIRPVPQLEQRLLEAARLGYKLALIPKRGKQPIRAPGVELLEIKNADVAIQQLA